MQTTITILILIASAAYAVHRTYNLFRGSGKHTCNGCKDCCNKRGVKEIQELRSCFRS